MPASRQLGSILAGAFLLGIVVAASGILAHALPDLTVPVRPMPELPAAPPEAWINSAPLTIAGLRGKVILVDVWATV